MPRLGCCKHLNRYYGDEFWNWECKEEQDKIICLSTDEYPPDEVISPKWCPLRETFSFEIGVLEDYEDVDEVYGLEKKMKEKYWVAR